MYSVLAFCAFSSTVQAQDMEEFKTRMADAAAMTKVDLGEALRQYLELRVQFAGPEVDYSLGRAYQRLNQCTEAQHYYTEVMVAYNLPEKNQIYQRAVKAYDEIASCSEWQKIYLDCEIPAGGYVLIDGERVAACWERAYSMSPGDHIIKLVDAKGKTKEVKHKAVNGSKEQRLHIAFEAEQVEVEKVVKEEHTYIMEEKFNPHLYWGLIGGGLALVAGGFGFLAMAHSAKVDEINYSIEIAKLGKESAEKDALEKKQSDANGKVKLGNALMGTFVGVGLATAATGATLAILSYVGDKKRVEVDNVSAYLSPMQDGFAMGIHLNFD